VPVDLPHGPSGTDPDGPVASGLLTLVFAFAAFIGASLLFVVQPMIARLLLPSYGGSATVWSTSSLFFQVLLLVGYIYAHWSTRRFGRIWQPRVHLLVLAVPLVLLPINLPADAAPGAESSPALWLLRTLALMIGLPFLVVSTTGPLLQKWYSWTNGRRSDDPYFLFAASNLGSFGGLLAYPFLIEPTLTLQQQQRTWSAAFVAYAVLTAVCGLAAARSRRAPQPAIEVPAAATDPLSRSRMARWLWWAFLPSALMLAVTAHVTTDVAAVPLLWVVPLAIYLATFVIAFSRTSRTLPATATRAAIAMAFLAALSGVMPSLGGSVLGEIAIGMAMLGMVAFVAHARLAADRPDPEHLTTFYIVVAVGGALGGVLNGFVAPIVFDRVLEYPLVMASVPLLMLGVAPTISKLDEFARRKVLWPVVLLGLAGVGVAGLIVKFNGAGDLSLIAWGSLVALSGILTFRIAEHTRVAVVALVLLFGLPMFAQQLENLDQSRTFFGSYRVLERDGLHVLVHGRTVHGSQFSDERSHVPTTYYARTGPLGAIFEARTPQELGVIGLGAGTIAAYGEPGMRITYFEIDPEIVRIARSRELFTYLADSKADIETVIGDGRLKVAEQPAGHFDALILDAFSSDAIPVHLLTEDAMEMYASRIKPDGYLAVHISNNVFDLEPVLAAAAADLGWSSAVGFGGSGDGASLSQWVVLSPSKELVDGLLEGEDWSKLGERKVRWTDDFSSILSVLR
jgi:hypothetical protein